MDVGKKSNKHSGDHSADFVERQIHQFELVEPDEVLTSVEEYKQFAYKFLGNFSVALFLKEGNFLEGRSLLSLEDIKVQQNIKMGVNLQSLILLLDGKSQSTYKNLDEFKSVVKTDVKVITVLHEWWKQVYYIAPKGLLQIDIELNKLSLAELGLCNLTQGGIPNYFKSLYLKSIRCSKNEVTFNKCIYKNYLGTYTDVHNKFYCVDSDVTIEVEYDIDLYFSHLRYLNKVISTYKAV